MSSVQTYGEQEIIGDFEGTKEETKSIEWNYIKNYKESYGNYPEGNKGDPKILKKDKN